MSTLVRFVATAIALNLFLTTAPSCGQLVNPTVSDDNGNTAGGTGALGAISPTTAGNTAFGLEALGSDTLGTDNTAIGLFALASTDTGNRNTATGRGALSSNTTGSHNTATGEAALFSNHVGSNNTAIGVHALVSSTGSKNIGIGYRAGVTLGTGNNNIYIGNQGAGDESQTIRIGTAQSQTFIAGIAGANPGNSELVAIDPATGQLGTPQLSSARYKQDIAPIGVRSEGVLQLRPVTFAYKDDTTATMHYGLVAEEVAAVYPNLVTYAPTGEVRTVKYQELIPMLLNELQRQQRELAELTVIRKELAELRALVGSIVRGP